MNGCSGAEMLMRYRDMDIMLSAIKQRQQFYNIASDAMAFDSLSEHPRNSFTEQNLSMTTKKDDRVRLQSEGPTLRKSKVEATKKKGGLFNLFKRKPRKADNEELKDSEKKKKKLVSKDIRKEYVKDLASEFLQPKSVSRRKSMQDMASEITSSEIQIFSAMYF